MTTHGLRAARTGDAAGAGLGDVAVQPRVPPSCSSSASRFASSGFEVGAVVIESVRFTLRARDFALQRGNALSHGGSIGASLGGEGAECFERHARLDQSRRIAIAAVAQRPADRPEREPEHGPRMRPDPADDLELSLAVESVPAPGIRAGCKKPSSS